MAEEDDGSPPPRVWGPVATAALNHAIFSYPDEPNAEEREDMLLHLRGLRTTLPCEECRGNWRTDCSHEEKGLTDEVVSSRKKLVRWWVARKNDVRERKQEALKTEREIQDEYNIQCKAERAVVVFLDANDRVLTDTTGGQYALQQGLDINAEEGLFNADVVEQYNAPVAFSSGSVIADTMFGEGNPDGIPLRNWKQLCQVQNRVMDRGKWIAIIGIGIAVLFLLMMGLWLWWSWPRGRRRASVVVVEDEAATSGRPARHVVETTGPSGEKIYCYPVSAAVTPPSQQQQPFLPYKPATPSVAAATNVQSQPLPPPQQQPAPARVSFSSTANEPTMHHYYQPAPASILKPPPNVPVLSTSAPASGATIGSGALYGAR